MRKMVGAWLTAAALVTVTTSAEAKSSETSPTKVLLAAMSACLADRPDDPRSREGGHGDTLGGTLASPARWQGSRFTRLSEVAVAFVALDGGHEPCGVIFRGAPSPLLLAGVDRLAKRSGMVRAATTYWGSKSSDGERSLAYWGDADAPALNGVLVSMRMTPNGPVTEIEYHILLLR